MDNAIRSYSWRLTAAVESLSPTGNACRLPYTACSNKQREMSWHLTFPNVSMKRNDYLGGMRGDPGGHLKLLHLWPGQIPPLFPGGTRAV